MIVLWVPGYPEFENQYGPYFPYDLCLVLYVNNVLFSSDFVSESEN